MANYAFKDNIFTEDPNDKVAQFVGVKSYTRAEIIERAASHGNVTSKIDLEASWNAIADEIRKIHEEGGTISTELFSTSLSIQGVFTDATDSFDPKRHTVRVNATAGSLIKEAVKKIKLTKVKVNPAAPNLETVRDFFADENTAVDTVKIGSVMMISGARLKFDPTDEEQGVFLVGEKTVRLSRAVENSASIVKVMIGADVSAGAYSVEVRTKLGSNSQATKILKTGVFERQITIVE